MNLIQLLLISLLFYSCGSKQQESKRLAEEVNTANSIQNQHHFNIPKGKITNPVICNEDSAQSYAAYLPANYDSTKKYPILIAFDAHAGGRIPVELYASLAEKYGYIIIGSNNSQNGLSQDATNHIVNVLLNDLSSRISINRKRIYLTGFSGGARVAANVALQDNICGLAACSAGFQPTQELNFNYIGFAGNEDFNSNEMLELDQMLDVGNSKHAFVLFDGKHEWPSKEVFEAAFVWFDINAMKDNLLKSNLPFLKAEAKSAEKKIVELSQHGQYLAAYYKLKYNLILLNGTIDCRALQNAKIKLESNATFQKIIAQNKAIQEREKALQNYYREAIQTKDLAWWMNEIDQLNIQSKKNSGEEKFMYKRTLSFLSLLSYMVSNSMLNQNQYAQAASYLNLYEKVDPTNPEVYYLKAILNAKTGNTKEVLPYLKKAVDNGFNDNERIKNETLFMDLSHEKEYLKIQADIHQKNNL